MADILDPARGAVVGEGPGLEVALLADPGVDHGFGREIAPGAGPQVLALGGLAVFGGVLEATGLGQVVGPLLGVGSQGCIPPHRLHADLIALEVVGHQEPLLQIPGLAHETHGHRRDRRDHQARRQCDGSDLKHNVITPKYSGSFRQSGVD